MISWGQRHHKVTSLHGKLPCRDKRHIRVSVGTDACGLDWTGCILHTLQERFRIIGSPRNVNTTKEAIAIHRVLRTCQDRLHDQGLMLLLTTRLAVVLSWNNQGLGTFPLMSR